MKNKKVNDFLQAMNENNKELIKKSKEPKFKIGDVIINTKFKVVSIVTNLAKAFPTGVIDSYSEKVLCYVLKDLENKAAQEFFAKDGRILDKEKRKRYKDVKKIDATYQLVDPMKAQLLYGKEVIDLKEKYEKNSFHKRSSNKRDN